MRRKKTQNPKYRIPGAKRVVPLYTSIILFIPHVVKAIYHLKTYSNSASLLQSSISCHRSSGCEALYLSYFRSLRIVC